MFWRNGCQKSFKDNILPQVKMYCLITKMQATGVPPMIQLQIQNENKNNYLRDEMKVLGSKIKNRNNDDIFSTRDTPMTAGDVQDMVPSIVKQIVPSIIQELIESKTNKRFVKLLIV